MIWNWNRNRPKKNTHAPCFSGTVCARIAWAVSEREGDRKNKHTFIFDASRIIPHYDTVDAVVCWKYDGQSVIQYNRIESHVCRAESSWYEKLNARMNDWLMCGTFQWWHATYTLRVRAMCVSATRASNNNSNKNRRKKIKRFYFMVSHSELPISLSESRVFDFVCLDLETKKIRK